MIRRLLNDWKYLLMLVVTVASVAGPFWLWRADQTGKSLSVAMLSQVALQPTDKDSVQGLQVLIDGTPLVEPFLSVIEVSNNGEKPITTADFEAPLEIQLLTKTNVARARVTAKSPSDIEPDISWEKQVLRLKPLLLNSKDKITLSVLTSGGQPQFSTKARIVGISAIPLVDATKPMPNRWKKWAFLAAALLFAIASTATSPTEALVGRKSSATLRRRTLIANSLVTGCTAAIFVNVLLDEIGQQSFWYYMLLCFTIFALATPFSLWLNRMPETVSGPSANADKH